jgi:hypothetical protein
MSDMSTGIILENPCVTKKDFCVNCHSHFMAIRPWLKTLVISRHFIRDLKDKEEVDSIVSGVLNCSNVDFNELQSLKKILMETLFSEQREMVSTYSTVWTRRNASSSYEHSRITMHTQSSLKIRKE